MGMQRRTLSERRSGTRVKTRMTSRPLVPAIRKNREEAHQRCVASRSLRITFVMQVGSWRRTAIRWKPLLTSANDKSFDDNVNYRQTCYVVL